MWEDRASSQMPVPPASFFPPDLLSRGMLRILAAWFCDPGGKQAGTLNLVENATTKKKNQRVGGCWLCL